MCALRPPGRSSRRMAGMMRSPYRKLCERRGVRVRQGRQRPCGATHVHETRQGVHDGPQGQVLHEAHLEDLGEGGAHPAGHSVCGSAAGGQQARRNAPQRQGVHPHRHLRAEGALLGVCAQHRRPAGHGGGALWHIPRLWRPHGRPGSVQRQRDCAAAAAGCGRGRWETPRGERTHSSGRCTRAGGPWGPAPQGQPRCPSPPVRRPGRAARNRPWQGCAWPAAGAVRPQRKPLHQAAPQTRPASTYRPF